MTHVFALFNWVIQVLREAGGIYKSLIKILVPAIIIVKLLQAAGVVELVGDLMAPLMNLIGLPSVLSLVWATTIFTNIVTGMVVFVNIAATEPLTVAQATVLGSLMLISHSIPVEGMVARRAGVPWWLTIVLRVGGAMLFGWLLHWSYQLSGTLQEASVLVWQPQAMDDSLQGWLIAQLKILVTIFFVIVFLVAVLKIIRLIGVEVILHKVIQPLLLLIGANKSAANTVIVGFTLGLTFGAGLLIRDIETGKLDRANAALVICFLGLCHGLIDDTLLVMLLGAHLSGVLWARILFATLLMAIYVHVLRGRFSR